MAGTFFGHGTATASPEFTKVPRTAARPSHAPRAGPRRVDPALRLGTTLKRGWCEVVAEMMSSPADNNGSAIPPRNAKTLRPAKITSIFLAGAEFFFILAPRPCLPPRPLNRRHVGSRLCIHTRGEFVFPDE
ncbi:hypothetical protein MRX96_040819 [Rhipicephalus microplus]